MSWVEVLLLAFALSIDACVVSFSYGIKGVQHPIKSALSLAVFTGGFQALMPFVGGICTSCVRCYIEPYAKWIVFAIFAVLSIVLISGHGSWVISGYNTASKEEKEKYDEKKLCRTMGVGMSVIAVLILIMGLFENVLPAFFVYIALGIILVNVVVIIILGNTLCRK